MRSNQTSITIEKTCVASINADRCVNCGTCEEYCPVNAISEKQKAVCHLCPDCTELKALTPDQITTMQSEACTLACPLGISPQGYINLLKDGKEKEAFELIFNKNPLPSVCGYVCHHPCEEACKRGKLVDNPMEIRALKRFLGEEFIDYEPAAYPVNKQERIAVIGAGPAGLTAAHWLSSKGYKVTVFEQNAEPGGMLIRGIPAFRLNKEVVRAEIARLEKCGIEIICNAKIGRDPSIETLLENYDRIVVATGNQVSKFLPIDGFRGEGIHLAINLMEKVNSGQKVKLSGKGIVIGGGSVAVDTARTALRLGADKVTIISLESGENIPAHKWEREEALEEGIEWIEGVSPIKFTGQTSHLEGVEYVKIADLDLKTFKFNKISGSETVIPVDFAIMAIGQKSDFDWPKDPKIVFAGDIASNKCSVIDAMSSGRMSAITIDNDLNGREYLDYSVERTVSAGDPAYKVYPAVRLKCDFPSLTKLDAVKRVNSFEVIENSLTDEAAKLETYRCLQCGYRFVDISKCIGCGVCSKVCPKGDVITMTAIPDDKEVK